MTQIARHHARLLHELRNESHFKIFSTDFHDETRIKSIFLLAQNFFASFDFLTELLEQLLPIRHDHEDKSSLACFLFSVQFVALFLPIAACSLA